MSDDTVSIGELSRTCERIESTLDAMREDAKRDRHAIHGRIDAHGIAIAVHAEQIKAVTEAHSGARNWIAGLVSGGLVAGFAWLMDFLRK